MGVFRVASGGHFGALLIASGPPERHFKLKMAQNSLVFPPEGVLDLCVCKSLPRPPDPSAGMEFGPQDPINLLARGGGGHPIPLHRHSISPLPSIRTPIGAPHHTLGGREAGSHGRNGVRPPYQLQQNGAGSTSFSPKGAEVSPEGSKGLPEGSKALPRGERRLLNGMQSLSRGCQGLF